jgi:hypothetical protein
LCLVVGEIIDQDETLEINSNQVIATTTTITRDMRIYPVVQPPQRLVYVHVVEVSHKGYGVPFNSLLFSNLSPRQ